MSSMVRKMRAHRVVLEQNCSICNAGFSLAEEVYQCSLCGGYHHVACWDARGTCAPGAPLLASSSPPEQPSFASPGASPIAPAAAGPKSPYASWSLETLEDALTTDRTSFQPAVIAQMEAEWKNRGGAPLKVCAACRTVSKSTIMYCTRCGNSLALAPEAPAAATPGAAPAVSTGMGPDERRCPTCAEIIKKEALKCRYCGHVLDSRYGVQSPGGVFSDTGKRLAEDKIQSDAKNALIMSIVGIFCFGFILAPVALFKASRVFSEIGQAEREYGSVDIGSARGQAIGAIVVGIIVLLLTVLYVIGTVANGGRSR